MSEILNPEGAAPQHTQSAKSSRRLPSFFKNFLYFLILIVIIGGTIFAIKTKPEILGLSKADQNQEEVQDLVANVGKIIELPPGEIPTLATVSDLSKVSDQAFFKNSKEGDKVLVYQTAKKAYLYRPSENKIIEVGVVNVQPETSEVAGESTDIEVVTPTPLSTQSISLTSTITPSPSPTLTPTRAATPPIETPPPRN